jgi:flotillin
LLTFLHLNSKKAATELERLRAKDLVRAQITKETIQQQADGDAYRQSKLADAKAYAEKQDGKYGMI